MLHHLIHYRIPIPNCNTTVSLTKNAEAPEEIRETAPSVSHMVLLTLIRATISHCFPPEDGSFSLAQVSVTGICVQNSQGQQQSGEIQTFRPELSLEEFEPHKPQKYTEILMPLCRIYTMSLSL